MLQMVKEQVTRAHSQRQRQHKQRVQLLKQQHQELLTFVQSLTHDLT
jgi:hypothetical protein